MTKGEWGGVEVLGGDGTVSERGGEGGGGLQELLHPGGVLPTGTSPPPPSISLYLFLLPGAFRDSFTPRISRAGDRASNPCHFSDAFLIVWREDGGVR